MKIASIQLLTFICIMFLLNCNNNVTESPSFETIEELKFTKFKKRKLKLEGILLFKNPTPFDIQLVASGFDLYYNGKKVDNIQSKKDHKIKAGEEYKHHFVSIVNSKEVLPLITDKTWEDFEKEEIDIEIKGEALAKFQNKSYNIDINYNHSLELVKEGGDDIEMENE